MQDKRNSDPLLDELLAEAHWPKVPPERLARLERYADRLRWRRRARRLGALAATLLFIAIGVYGWRGMVERNEERVVQEIPQSQPKASITELHEEVEVEIAKDVSHGREANTYEQAVMLLHRSRTARIEREKQEWGMDPLELALSTVINQPGINLETVSKRLAAADANCEIRLQDLVRSAPGPRREAAVRILASVATRPSLPVLFTCLQRGDQPADVVEAIARLSSPEELATLIRQGYESYAREAWMMALAERESPEAVRHFLAFVEDPEYKPLALSMCSEAARPAADAWFAALNSSRVPTRMAAARALGTLNDPKISSQLARLATEGVPRPEVLAALLTSTDAVAEEFCRAAREDSRIWPSLQSIDQQLRRDGVYN